MTTLKAAFDSAVSIRETKKQRVTRKGREHVIDQATTLVRRGEVTIEQVPLEIRADVRVRLARDGD